MGTQKSLPLIGFASGNGASNPDTNLGPFYIQNHTDPRFSWEEIISNPSKERRAAALDSIAQVCEALCKKAQALTQNHQPFVTLGGDHTCAIGTWSGVATAITPDNLGLLWIDAHLDSHTPQTSHSQNIHGMPLAVLLGYGEKKLTQIGMPSPKLLPENVCFLGARSYETEEQAFLEQLNVRIFYMDEIHQRGLAAVMQDAYKIVTKADYFGISLDLDAFDPKDAPGVGTPEPFGIRFRNFQPFLADLLKHPQLIATEIAEFNPNLDIDDKTLNIIMHFLNTYYDAKYSNSKVSLL